MNTVSTPSHPVAIFIRGLPGSGKSFVAASLASALGKDNAVLLDPDATDYESNEYKEHVKTMQAEGVEEQLHAYRFLRGQAYKAIEDHKIIVWDQPFRNLEIFHKMVGRLNDHAAAHQTRVPILVVEVEIDPLVAKQRVNERKQRGGHGPSDASFQRFINEHTSFADQGFALVKVNGENEASQSVEAIMQALEPLLT